MMALITVRGNSIIIKIYTFCNTTQLYNWMDIGMQIIHFKKFCVPVSTGTSKCNKLLKMSSDSMSDSAIFLGGMSHTPSVSIFCMPLCFARYESTYYIPANPTSTMMTDLAMSPFSKV